MYFFETVRPYIVYQAFTYLKPYNEFYEDISIVNGPLSKNISTFSDTDEIQDYPSVSLKKCF